MSSRPRLQPGPRCGTTAALERIALVRPELAAAITAAIDNPDVAQGKAAEFLTKHAGRTVKAAAVGYHRRRGTVYGCSCPPKETS